VRAVVVAAVIYARNLRRALRNSARRKFLRAGNSVKTKAVTAELANIPAALARKLMNLRGHQQRVLKRRKLKKPLKQPRLRRGHGKPRKCGLTFPHRYSKQFSSVKLIPPRV
jgi:hypothetical protein